MQLKLRKIGNSVGVVLPKEALAHLQAGEGDTLELTPTVEGFQISGSQSDFARTMAVIKDLSKRYQNTLRELAK